MLCAIMQPTYLPWLGYFDLIDRVDYFVFLDNAKVLKRSWGVRNRIRTVQGEFHLTVPLKAGGDQTDRFFNNTEIDYGQDWVGRHLKTIAHSYGKSAYFAEVFGDLESLMSTRYPNIGTLNIRLIEHFSSRIGINTGIVRSSELACTRSRKDQRLVAICHALGADQYLSPQGSAAYIEKGQAGGAFNGSGVELWYHHYLHPEYSQRGVGFLSHMAIIDLLMNCGYDSALEIIRSGRREMIGFMEFRKTLTSAPGLSLEPSDEV